MELFVDFIDYCVEHDFIHKEKEELLKDPGIIDAAIGYAKAFAENVKMDYSDVDDRYTAVCHAYAAGVWVAIRLNAGKSIPDSLEDTLQCDSIYLVKLKSGINGNELDAMTTVLEDIYNPWIAKAATKEKWSLRLTNVMIGSYLLGYMTYKQ